MSSETCEDESIARVKDHRDNLQAGDIFMYMCMFIDYIILDVM